MTRFAATSAFAAILLPLACIMLPPSAQANLYTRAVRAMPAISSGSAVPVPRTGARTRRAVPAPKPAVASSSRTAAPVIVADGIATGQAGFVHFFQILLPDGTPEIQVGIELSDQRIAWSFPGLGVTVSPFIEEGIVAAHGKSYEVWHLYGIRPFPEDAAMQALRRDLASRIERWVRAATPYCGTDSLGSQCMSCLGFVLRVLYPGRGTDYPDLPADFWRTDPLGRYTTNDLLLYLTGMLELPTRQARLRRIARLGLPDELRTDLEALVYAMGPHESSPSAQAGAAPKRPGARPPARVGTRPAQRKRL